MFLLLAYASAALYTVNEERNFLQWMRETNNLYTGAEYHFRLGVFMTTLRYIEDFNRDKTKTYRLGLSRLSALTRSEYLSMLGTRRTPASHAVTATGRVKDAPSSIDWREKGVVNGIKDQGQCGSCWAFGAIQTCESAYAIQNHELLCFSESNLVDCVGDCMGCNGGYATAAIHYITRSQKGMFMSEEDYPYAPVLGTCQYDSDKAIGHCSGYVTVTERSEDDLKEKVGTMGPACANINSSPSDFHHYSGGIYSSSACVETTINHAVGVVGYGSFLWMKYWIVRNSWGTSWGEKGYMRLSRNDGNKCSIASDCLVAKP